MGDLLVSVVCITYNQEAFIADAIESFLMQKTDFGYEVLIHDDASTDRTPDIIWRYTLEYPEIIKPIYQMENQYSKGVHVLDFYQAYAKGKYIAICEGDDYWTDPSKLQKQVDYMEKHPDCSVCVHGAIKVHAVTHKKVGKVQPSKDSRDYTTQEVILGGGGLFATNSMLYPRVFSKPPQFYLNCSVGDYPLMIHLALCGRVHYMGDLMSAYRVGDVGSWTVQLIKACMDTKKEHVNRIEQMLREVDAYTNKAYTTTIHKKMMKNRFDLLVCIGAYEEARSETYIEQYKALSLYEKLNIFIKQHLPKITMLFKTIKRKYE
ncbi:glycosyltransferase family 2 protein [Petrocella sp. FN5]|uniref:glycosyltransferase family 2 protein n=1 Tax=Petrocella sp. FN5 TaxID=3032002 RepID=UPI0023DA6F3F|nr:glycosyltransferase [Petrocella sp. FN5]MDF1618119.1 glycosyltransferase [Petrocella sp. FN5]